MLRSTRTALACSVLALTACGGGGDDPPAPAPLPSVSLPIRVIEEKLTTTPATYTVNGRLPTGEVVQISLQQTAAGQSNFGGVAAEVMNVITTASVNGRMVSASNSRNFFLRNPLRSLGDEGASGSNTESVTTSGSSVLELPERASTGQSGPHSTATIFELRNRNRVFGTVATSWSVEGETATTAWYCTSTTINPAPNSGIAGGTAKACTRSNPAGDILGVRVETNVNGVRLVLQ